MNQHNDFLVALRRITRAIDLHSRQLAKETGLTVPQLLVLQEVGKSGRARPSDVARSIHLSQATITSIADRLARAGLITRERSAVDRRTVDIVLSESGRAQLEAAPALLQEEFQHAFDGLKDWERSQLISSLQRIAAMMDAGSLDAAPILEVGELSPPGDDTG